jgi:DNA-binding Lrp family transcriptional regulator
MSNDLQLDQLDRDILFHLQRDGRLTNVELAKRVGLIPDQQDHRYSRRRARHIPAHHEEDQGDRLTGRG